VKPESVTGENAAAVIDIGGRSSTFAFVDKAGLQLSVTLPVAGDAFTAAIAKKLKIKADVAETQKRNEGFQSKDVAEILRKAIEPLTDEFARAASWYEGTKQRRIRRAFLAGGSSVLPGLMEELTTRLNVPVEFGVPPFKVTGLEPHQIAVVSGLAMRAKKLSPGMNFIVPS
jgi:Tfp pilus assembly PilM family ATPase